MNSCKVRRQRSTFPPHTGRVVFLLFSPDMSLGFQPCIPVICLHSQLIIIRVLHKTRCAAGYGRNTLWEHKEGPACRFTICVASHSIIASFYVSPSHYTSVVSLSITRSPSATVISVIYTRWTLPPCVMWSCVPEGTIITRYSEK